MQANGRCTVCNAVAKAESSQNPCSGPAAAANDGEMASLSAKKPAGAIASPSDQAGYHGDANLTRGGDAIAPAKDLPADSDDPSVCASAAEPTTHTPKLIRPGSLNLRPLDSSRRLQRFELASMAVNRAEPASMAANRAEPASMAANRAEPTSMAVNDTELASMGAKHAEPASMGPAGFAYSASAAVAVELSTHITAACAGA